MNFESSSVRSLRCVLTGHRPLGICIAVLICQCREHAVWTLVSTTCSLHLTVSLLVGVYVMRSNLHCAIYLHKHRSRITCMLGILPITWVTSPGVGFAIVGKICNPRYTCFTLGNPMNA